VDIFGEASHAKLRDLLVEVSKYNVLLMGEFNYGDKRWNGSLSYAVTSTSVETTVFVECVHDSFLSQHVLEATRGTDVLDLIFSTEADLDSNMQRVGHLADSVCSMITFSVHMRAQYVTYERCIYDYCLFVCCLTAHQHYLGH